MTLIIQSSHWPAPRPAELRRRPRDAGVFTKQLDEPLVTLLVFSSQCQSQVANFRRHRNAGLPGFNAQVIEQGQRAEQRLLEVATLGAPAEVAARLDLDEPALVIVRRRLFLVEDQPVALCDSYYPAAMAQGTAIAEPKRIPGGALAVIEDPVGSIRRTAARSVDELTSRMPTRPEIDRLRLSPGVPVVRVLRTIYDTEGTPLEVQDSVAAADCHEFRYEVQMR